MGPGSAVAPRRKHSASKTRVNALMSLRSIRGTTRSDRDRQPLSPRPFLVLAMSHQIVDHGGVRQRRGVAEASRFVFGDLAQDAAHDLAGAGLRQTRRELNLVRRGDRSD